MAGNAFVPLSGAITAPLLASSLGVAGRGEVAAATTPLLLAVTVAGLGLPEAATYFIARRKHSRRTFWSLWLGLVAGSAMGMAAIWFARDFLAGNDPELASIILSCALALPICLAGGMLRGIAAGRQMWLLVNSERFLTAFLRLAGIISLLGTDSLNVLSASATIVLSQALGSIVYAYLWFTREHTIADNLRPPTFGRIYRFSSGTWLGALAGVLLLRFDQLLMLPLSDSQQLGIYAVAVNIAELMLIGSNAIRDVMYSAESADPNPERLALAARLAFYTTLLLSASTFLACTLFLPIIFGEEFASATFLFGIMTVGFSLGAPGSIFGAGLASKGVPHLRSISLVVAAVVNILLVIALVPPFGALGAAIATSVCAGLGGVLNQAIYSRRYAVPFLSAYAFRLNDYSRLYLRLRRNEVKSDSAAAYSE